MRTLSLNQYYKLELYKDKPIENAGSHQHDFYEVFFFVGEEIIYLTQNIKYVVKPGEILLINPYTQHNPLSNKNRSGSYRYVLWLNKNLIERLSNKDIDLSKCFSSPTGIKVIYPSNEQFEEALAILKLLHEEDKRVSKFNESGDSDKSDNIFGKVKNENKVNIRIQGNKLYARDLYAYGLIQSLLVILNRVSPRKSNFLDGSLNKYSLLSSIVIEFIKMNYDQNLKLEDVADRFGMNKFTLNKIIKKESGKTFYKQLSSIRIEKATEMMKSECNITDVAMKIGFEDYSSFYRMFKKLKGLSPSEYQIKLLNDQEL